MLTLLVAAAPQASPSQAPAGPPPVPTNHWSADPAHSAVAFRVRHLGITWVNGTFGQWTADLNYEPAKPEAATVTAHIQAATISTGNDRRDNDLRTNYLATDSFPEITFKSTRVERTAPDHLRVTGDLTIRGITRSVTLHVESVSPEIKDPDGFLRRGASANMRIERKDFGLTWNAVLESGGFLVGDDVDITIDVELMRKEQ